MSANGAENNWINIQWQNDPLNADPKTPFQVDQCLPRSNTSEQTEMLFATGRKLLNRASTEPDCFQESDLDAWWEAQGGGTDNWEDCYWRKGLPLGQQSMKKRAIKARQALLRLLNHKSSHRKVTRAEAQAAIDEAAFSVNHLMHPDRPFEDNPIDTELWAREGMTFVPWSSLSVSDSLVSILQGIWYADHVIEPRLETTNQDLHDQPPFIWEVAPDLLRPPPRETRPQIQLTCAPNAI
jgi:hypothetical protein